MDPLAKRGPPFVELLTSRLVPQEELKQTDRLPVVSKRQLKRARSAAPPAAAAAPPAARLEANGSTTKANASGISKSRNRTHRSSSTTGTRSGLEVDLLQLRGDLEHFRFPLKLQDPVLASRRYRVVKKLGHGSYGKVYLAWDERRMRVVAVKVQSKQRNQELGGEEFLVKFLRREIACLKEQHHENIVEWFHTIETTTDLYVSLEFCSGPTILKLLEECHTLKVDISQYFFVQLLSALIYLHGKSYCHRDLKNENLMLDRPFDERNYKRIVVKVTDFGFARSSYVPYRGTAFRRVQHSFAHTCCATYPYASPELLYQKGDYNALANDLWSMGVILYEMITARLPFDRPERRDIFERQMLGVKFNKTFEWNSPLPVDLIIGILQFNPEERFVMRDVLLHPFIFEKYVNYERTRLASTIAADLELSLLSEEKFVAPYRLSADCINHVLYQQNLYRERLHPNARSNPYAGMVQRHRRDALPPIPRVIRSIEFAGAFERSTEFPERPLLIKCVATLFAAQQLPSTCSVPSVQDALTLLQAILYRPTSDYAPQLLQRAAVALCSAVSELNAQQTSIAAYIYSKEGGENVSSVSYATFVKDMANLKLELAELQRLDTELVALLKRVDLLAERSEPGFIERHLVRLLESSAPVFVGPNGNLVGRTPNGCAIGANASGAPTAISVPRDRQQLRATVEECVRAQLANTPLEGRAQLLSSRLQQMHACQHRLRHLAETTSGPPFAMHFEEFFEVNVEVAQSLLSESPVPPEKPLQMASVVQKQVSFGGASPVNAAAAASRPSTSTALLASASRPMRFQAPSLSVANWSLGFGQTGANMWGATNGLRVAQRFPKASLLRAPAQQRGMRFNAPTKKQSDEDF